MTGPRQPRIYIFNIAGLCMHHIATHDITVTHAFLGSYLITLEACITLNRWKYILYVNKLGLKQKHVSMFVTIHTSSII